MGWWVLALRSLYQPMAMFPWYVIPVVVVVVVVVAVVVSVVYHGVTVLALLTEDRAHHTQSHTRHRAQEPPPRTPRRWAPDLLLCNQGDCCTRTLQLYYKS